MRSGSECGTRRLDLSLSALDGVAVKAFISLMMCSLIRSPRSVRIRRHRLGDGVVVSPRRPKPADDVELEPPGDLSAGDHAASLPGAHFPRRATTSWNSMIDDQGRSTARSPRDWRPRSITCRNSSAISSPDCSPAREASSPRRICINSVTSACDRRTPKLLELLDDDKVFRSRAAAGPHERAPETPRTERRGTSSLSRSPTEIRLSMMSARWA